MKSNSVDLIDKRWQECETTLLSVGTDYRIRELLQNLISDWKSEMECDEMKIHWKDQVKKGAPYAKNDIEFASKLCVAIREVEGFRKSVDTLLLVIRALFWTHSRIPTVQQILGPHEFNTFENWYRILGMKSDIVELIDEGWKECATTLLSVGTDCRELLQNLISDWTNDLTKVVKVAEVVLLWGDISPKSVSLRKRDRIGDTSFLRGTRPRGTLVTIDSIAWENLIGSECHSWWQNTYDGHVLKVAVRHAQVDKAVQLPFFNSKDFEPYLQ